MIWTRFIKPQQKTYQRYPNSAKFTKISNSTSNLNSLITFRIKKMTPLWSKTNPQPNIQTTNKEKKLIPNIFESNLILMIRYFLPNLNKILSIYKL